MSTLGMVTVGQSPRSDIVPNMKERMGFPIGIVEKGALDNLTFEEITALAPRADEGRLCTRLTDGREVVVVKEKIIPLVQEKIQELNRESVDLIVLLCTGHFPRFQSRCLVIEAEKVVDQCIQALVDHRHSMGVVVPLPEQTARAKDKLSTVTANIHVVSASPYRSLEDTRRAAVELKNADVDMIVLHCMGFYDAHRKIMRETTGKPVLVANSIVARTVAELLTI